MTCARCGYMQSTPRRRTLQPGETVELWGGPRVDVGTEVRLERDGGPAWVARVVQSGHPVKVKVLRWL